MDRRQAKRNIRKHCGDGWLNLVDIIYDNRPTNINISEVFQKFGGLKITFEGEDNHFEELEDTIYQISQYLCEKCGKSANHTVIDGWETTLCDEHYGSIEGIIKYRQEKE